MWLFYFLRTAAKGGEVGRPSIFTMKNMEGWIRAF
jgi:hypothetical protein